MKHLFASNMEVEVEFADAQHFDLDYVYTVDIPTDNSGGKQYVDGQTVIDGVRIAVFDAGWDKPYEEILASEPLFAGNCMEFVAWVNEGTLNALIFKEDGMEKEYRSLAHELQDRLRNIRYLPSIVRGEKEGKRVYKKVATLNDINAVIKRRFAEQHPELGLNVAELVAIEQSTKLCTEQGCQWCLIIEWLHAMDRR